MYVMIFAHVQYVLSDKIQQNGATLNGPMISVDRNRKNKPFACQLIYNNWVE